MKKTITLSRRDIKRASKKQEYSIYHIFEDGTMVEILAITPKQLLIVWGYKDDNTEIDISSCVGTHTLAIDGKEYILEVKTKTLF